MKYLTTAQLNKIAHKRGTILKECGSISLVRRDASEIGNGLVVFTVWNFEEGYIFTNTTCAKEAADCFIKYTNLKAV